MNLLSMNLLIELLSSPKEKHIQTHLSKATLILAGFHENRENKEAVTNTPHDNILQ